MELAHPHVACDVTLILPDREMLRGRVDVSAEPELEIALLVAPRTPVAVLEAANLYVEWVTALGVCRLRGRVRLLGRGPRVTDQQGVWDVVRFTASSSPQLLQRREFVRTDFLAPVNLAPARPDGIAVACRTVDISGGGMLVRGLEGIAVGEVLLFQLAPLEARWLPIHGRCEVVRVTAEGDCGVRFTVIDEADRERLVTFAYARELVRRGRELAA